MLKSTQNEFGLPSLIAGDASRHRGTRIVTYLESFARDPSAFCFVVTLWLVRQVCGSLFVLFALTIATVWLPEAARVDSPDPSTAGGRGRKLWTWEQTEGGSEWRRKLARKCEKCANISINLLALCGSFINLNETGVLFSSAFELHKPLLVRSLSMNTDQKTNKKQ